MLKKEYEKKEREYDSRCEEEDKLYNAPYSTSSTSSSIPRTTPPLPRRYPIQECQLNHQEGTKSTDETTAAILTSVLLAPSISPQEDNYICTPLTTTATTAILSSLLLALIITTSLVIWLLLP